MAVDHNERVKIAHPDLPDTQEHPPIVPRHNLESTWRHKGFTLWKPATKKKEN